MGSVTDGDSERNQAAAGGSVKCEGVVFTLTMGNEVALVTRGGATRALGSESYRDANTHTRHHFVDVQGKAEAMLFLVSVREDQRCIVAVRRLS